MDCQFQIVISQVSFGGISVLVAYLGPQGRTLRNLGHRNQSPESTKSPETEGSGDMLNNTEHPRVQLHFLYTKENERKTQGKVDNHSNSLLMLPPLWQIVCDLWKWTLFYQWLTISSFFWREVIS